MDDNFSRRGHRFVVPGRFTVVFLSALSIIFHLTFSQHQAPVRFVDGERR